MKGYFLRLRRGQAERKWLSDRHDARAKGHALHVLGSAVIVARHPYERDPASGAGNCWCGRHESSDLHSVVMESALAVLDGEPGETP